MAHKMTHALLHTKNFIVDSATQSSHDTKFHPLEIRITWCIAKIAFMYRDSLLLQLRQLTHRENRELRFSRCVRCRTSSLHSFYRC